MYIATFCFSHNFYSNLQYAVQICFTDKYSRKYNSYDGLVTFACILQPCFLITLLCFFRCRISQFMCLKPIFFRTSWTSDDRVAVLNISPLFLMLAPWPNKVITFDLWGYLLFSTTCRILPPERVPLKKYSNFSAADNRVFSDDYFYFRYFDSWAEHASWLMHRNQFFTQSNSPIICNALFFL